VWGGLICAGVVPYVAAIALGYKHRSDAD